MFNNVIISFAICLFATLGFVEICADTDYERDVLWQKSELAWNEARAETPMIEYLNKITPKDRSVRKAMLEIIERNLEVGGIVPTKIKGRKVFFIGEQHSVFREWKPLWRNAAQNGKIYLFEEGPLVHHWGHEWHGSLQVPESDEEKEESLTQYQKYAFCIEPSHVIDLRTLGNYYYYISILGTESSSSDEAVLNLLQRIRTCPKMRSTWDGYVKQLAPGLKKDIQSLIDAADFLKESSLWDSEILQNMAGVAKYYLPGDTVQRLTKDLLKYLLKENSYPQEVRKAVLNMLKAKDKTRAIKVYLHLVMVEYQSKMMAQGIFRKLSTLPNDQLDAVVRVGALHIPAVLRELNRLLENEAAGLDTLDVMDAIL